MKPPLLTPAQIRAARGLLDWSQERLAKEADVGLSTVRDFERERRGATVGALHPIWQTLLNHAVVFLPGDLKNGPGVCLAATMANVLRRPRKVGRFEDLVVAIEWRGHEYDLYLDRSLLDDAGRLTGGDSEDAYIALFEKFRGQILQAAGQAIDAGRIQGRRVSLSGADLPELVA